MTTAQLSRELVNESNAFDVVTGLTRKLVFQLRSGDKVMASVIRRARKDAFDRYEELFGADELDDAMDICDRIVIGEIE
jgi:hypothetical protein